jgi:hypothetical protein
VLFSGGLAPARFLTGALITASNLTLKNVTGSLHFKDIAGTNLKPPQSHSLNRWRQVWVEARHQIHSGG